MKYEAPDHPCIRVCQPGELPGEVVTVLTKPEGIKTLIDLPLGLAIAKLDTLFLLTQVYLYLETTSSWDLFGANSQKSSADLKQKIQDGEEM